MISVHHLFFALSLLPAIVFAAPADLRKDMPYLFAARKLLLKEGWMPANLHLHDDYAMIGVEHELSRNNFKEFESCSIDYSNCVMRYKRARQCLTVYTIGEKIRDMKVVDWNSQCALTQQQQQISSDPSNQ